MKTPEEFLGGFHFCSHITAAVRNLLSVNVLGVNDDDLNIAVSVCVVSYVSQLLAVVVLSSLLELAADGTACIVGINEQNYGIMIIVADVQSELSILCIVSDVVVAVLRSLEPTRVPSTSSAL